MKTAKTELLVFIACLLCGCFLGFWYGRTTAPRPNEGNIITTDTITRYDTLFVKSPIPSDSIVVKYITKTLPKSGNNDGNIIPKSGNNEADNIPAVAEVADSNKVEVIIPITQKRYDGENYSAWVSGYEPSLDSIFVSQRTDVVTIREKKPPNKWHIGVQCGVGYTFKSKQFEPFIGIGISYSIFSF